MKGRLKCLEEEERSYVALIFLCCCFFFAKHFPPFMISRQLERETLCRLVNDIFSIRIGDLHNVKPLRLATSTIIVIKILIKGGDGGSLSALLNCNDELSIWLLGGSACEPGDVHFQRCRRYCCFNPDVGH